MIRFIEKGEARGHPSELIGRFVGKAGVMHARGYSRPMKVVRVSGSRLHGFAGEMIGSASRGDWRFAPVENWSEACHLDNGSVAYVCDTVEECEALLEASRRSLTTWSEGIARVKSEIDQDFERVVAQFESDPSPTP